MMLFLNSNMLCAATGMQVRILRFMFVRERDLERFLRSHLETIHFYLRAHSVDNKRARVFNIQAAGKFYLAVRSCFKKAPR